MRFLLEPIHRFFQLFQGCLNDVEKCDGIYGPTTKEMVKQYQKDNDLRIKE